MLTAHKLKLIPLQGGLITFLLSGNIQHNSEELGITKLVLI